MTSAYLIDAAGAAANCPSPITQYTGLNAAQGRTSRPTALNKNRGLDGPHCAQVWVHAAGGQERFGCLESLAPPCRGVSQASGAKEKNPEVEGRETSLCTWSPKLDLESSIHCDFAVAGRHGSQVEQRRSVLAISIFGSEATCFWGPRDWHFRCVSPHTSPISEAKRPSGPHLDQSQRAHSRRKGAEDTAAGSVSAFVGDFVWIQDGSRKVDAAAIMFALTVSLGSEYS